MEAWFNSPRQAMERKRHAALLFIEVSREQFANKFTSYGTITAGRNHFIWSGKLGCVLTQTWLRKCPCIISLRIISFTNSICYSHTTLFGPCWRKREPIFSDFGFAPRDDCTRSSISTATQNLLFYHAAVRSKYHFDVNIFRALKNYNYSCYNLYYKQTRDTTTGKFAAMLPAIVLNYNILNEEIVVEVIDGAAVNNGFN